MMSTASEFLEDAELVAMTGRTRSSEQIKWLNARGWKYELTANSKPIVGRVYTRLKLAGVKPSEQTAVVEPWSLDLSRVD